MKKRIIAALAALSVLGSTLALSGCTFTSSNYNAMQDYDFSSIQLVQLEDPQEGDTIAIFDTDLGEFRAVLYDEYCPNTVAAFVERANAGKYDGLPVYAVVQDTYFLTGGHENDKGVYTGRDSDDEALAHEYNVDLWPFRGALVTYSELPGYSDARYLVCNNDDMAMAAARAAKGNAAYAKTIFVGFDGIQSACNGAFAVRPARRVYLLQSCLPHAARRCDVGGHSGVSYRFCAGAACGQHLRG